jgi:N-acetylhexosamine 1-kinase
VAGARTHHRFADPAQAAAGAAAAAWLVGDLADLPGPPLREVIPGFHDVEARLADLARAASEDPAGRARDCRLAIDGVLGHAAVAAEVAAARGDGRLPARTVHNDAKADNIAFDERSGAVICLVDLDTVGPGTVLFDVGDLVRSGAPTGPEDGDPARTGVRADIVDAVLGAYADAGAAWLTGPEVDLLPLAGPLMALEAAARFLTDHLRGDVYFAVDGPGHNLRRARTQLRVLELLT